MLHKHCFLDELNVSKNFLFSSSKTLRASTITPFLVNKFVLVHKGSSFVKLKIKSNMLGFKIGEFVFTKKRTMSIHAKLLLKLKAQKIKMSKKIIKKTNIKT